MHASFFVTGGEYTDTTFTTLAPGQSEQRFGPFSEREAIDCWRSLTGKSVDNALVRYFIESGTNLSKGEWFVLGGEYSDTSFHHLAEGAKLQVHGPYGRDEALARWRELTGRTVDSATTRFDLRESADLENFLRSVTSESY